MLDRLRLPVYGDDDGAALRDILFVVGADVSGRRREWSAGDWRFPSGEALSAFLAVGRRAQPEASSRRG